ncbi:MAG: Ig domain-containing protein [Eubacterium sp.]
MKFKRILASALAVAMIGTLGSGMTATQSQAAKKYVKSLSVKKSVTVQAGKSVSVTAKVKAVKKASTKVKATIDKKSVATVKVKGKKITITGKKAGKAVVTVKTAAKNKKGKVIAKKINVTVKAKAKAKDKQPTDVVPTPAPTNPPVVVPTAPPIIPPAPTAPAVVQKLTLDKTEIAISQTETAKITATVDPAGTVIWTSSDADVATVDQNGKVTGTGIGSAVITAKIGNATATCNVKVGAKIYEVKSISSINTDQGTIAVTFVEKADSTVLAGTKINIVSANNKEKFTATFKELTEDGMSAVYVFTPEDTAKIQNGNYSVESGDINIPNDNATTSARVDIKGSSIKGLIYTREGGFYNTVRRVPNASITINKETTYSDEKGFYQKKVTDDTYPEVVVKADGFFDESKEQVKVTSNKASAYNFEMEVYDVEKVYLYGTVTKEGDAKTTIEGADVRLYRVENGKKVEMSVVNTDKNGKFVFANYNADFSKFGVQEDSAVRFPGFAGLDSEYKYVIEIHRDLSEDNLFDVYEPYESKEFSLGSKRGVDVGASLKAVDALKEMTIQLSWDKDCSSKGDLDVTLYDTDGCTKLVSNVLKLEDDDFTSSTEKKEMKENEYQLIKHQFFSEKTNVKPTLPAGTYYLVIRAMNNETSEQDGATVVCPVKVTPGTVANADSGLVTTAVERNIYCTASISDEFKETVLANQGDTLNTLVDNKGTLSSMPVSFESYVYQVVDGVDVLLDEINGHEFKKNENDVYASNFKQFFVDASKTYVIKTEKSHLVDTKESQFEGTSKNWNVDFDACANVINVKFANGECFVDMLNDDNTASIDDKLYLNAMNVTVYKKGTDNVIEKRNIPIDKEYTISDLVNGINIPADAIEAKGLPVGDCTVDFDFENYKLDTSDTTNKDKAEQIVDLQDAKLICDAKYEKVYPTMVSGIITYEDTTKTVPTNGTAVLYTENFEKIVAAAKLEKVNGLTTFCLADGEDGNFQGGTYQLLIRGEGFDYVTKEITLATNEVKQDASFEGLAVGGTTTMKPQVRTNTNAGLSGTSYVTAYDKYYIDPWNLDVVDVIAASVLRGDDFNGAFALHRESDDEFTWQRKDMSKGDYTIDVYSDLTDEETFEVALRGTYEGKLEVQLTKYENLVRIQLSLTNDKTDNKVAYEDGQVDYITAVSTDGEVSFEGVMVRDQQEKDTGYFYVPEGKEYNISVYSDKNYVETATRPAQYNENEKVSITVLSIE